ncbi:type VI secretion system tip protein VgrG, partial [Pseudomonas sp. CDFA 602]|nr:type VI secretion system tip protein VgrG [Pseudomonas californiensis]MCD6003141.1 type VI secretion system tip protein VgrG [Pseudomonas californiensis]
DRVEANSYSEFKAQEHRTVDGDRLTEAKADDHLSVGGTRHIKVGEALLAEAGREIHFKAGDKVVIEAGMEITVKVGGSFFKIDPGGVTLTGPQVKLNSGGKPSAGTGSTPLLPGRLKDAAKDIAGKLLKQRLSEQMPVTELCQKPENGTPMDCPLTDCRCRKALNTGGKP